MPTVSCIADCFKCLADLFSERFQELDASFHVALCFSIFFFKLDLSTYLFITVSRGNFTMKAEFVHMCVC